MTQRYILLFPARPSRSLGDLGPTRRSHGSGPGRPALLATELSEGDSSRVLWWHAEVLKHASCQHYRIGCS